MSRPRQTFAFAPTSSRNVGCSSRSKAIRPETGSKPGNSYWRKLTARTSSIGSAGDGQVGLDRPKMNEEVFVPRELKIALRLWSCRSFPGHDCTLAQKRCAFQRFLMEAVYAELASALRERLAIVADAESRRDIERHTARLRRVSERIEQIEQRLPETIDPQLRHFLQRRSYSKVLEFIEAPAART